MIKNIYEFHMLTLKIIYLNHEKTGRQKYKSLQIYYRFDNIVPVIFNNIKSFL
jgi:hypothetical protein